MDLTDAIQLIVAAVVAGWGIYQTRITHALQHDVERLNRNLDQRVQRLNRALELVRQLYVVWCDHHYRRNKQVTDKADKMAEFVVTVGELAALARVIGDSELQALLRQLVRYYENVADDDMFSKASETFRALFARIYVLIEDATVKANKQ